VAVVDDAKACERQGLGIFHGFCMLNPAPDQ
jgi:hypothetical protein